MQNLQQNNIHHNEQIQIARFAQSLACLPQSLQLLALALPQDVQAQVEEIRLRAGWPPTYRTGVGERTFAHPPVTNAQLHEVLSRATQYSVHTFADCLRMGFLPLSGGHRLGLCGTVSLAQGQVSGVRTISSMALRIASERQGVGEGVYASLLQQKGVMEASKLPNLLIISPPACGKTTLLRDVIRLLSNGGLRVSVVDARGEIAALHAGVPQFDVGKCTDVLDGCPKAVGALQLVRTMSPQVLALDEITDRADTQALVEAAHCGVKLVATIHAAGVAELRQKPLYRELLACGVFDAAAVIAHQNGVRSYHIHWLDDMHNCDTAKGEVEVAAC